MKNRILLLIASFAITYSGLQAVEVLDLYKGFGVDVKHDLSRIEQDGGEILGYYMEPEDRIHLCKVSAYHGAPEFNHTALHELAHWTRHHDRLGPIGGTYRTPDCYEEAVVDITALIVANELGIPFEPKQEIVNYVHFQLGPRLKQQEQQLLINEVHTTVEYILKKEYSREKLIHCFRDLQLIS